MELSRRGFMKMCGIAVAAPAALVGVGGHDKKLYAADLQRIMARIKAESIRTVTYNVTLSDDNHSCPIDWLRFTVLK